MQAQMTTLRQVRGYRKHDLGGRESRASGPGRRFHKLRPGVGQAGLGGPDELELVAPVDPVAGAFPLGRDPADQTPGLGVDLQLGEDRPYGRVGLRLWRCTTLAARPRERHVESSLV